MLSPVEAKRAFEEQARWTTRDFSQSLVFPWFCFVLADTGGLGMHFGAHLGALGATIWPTWGRFDATLSKVVAKQAVDGVHGGALGPF